MQGGNDIHAKGVSEIAQVLKDNSVIAAVSASQQSLSKFWTFITRLDL